MNTLKLIRELEEVIRVAGNIVMSYYDDPAVKIKDDLSVVTKADEASHNFLISALSKIKNIPILSEEDVYPSLPSNNIIQYWLIDPLDGTKEFITHLDEFCINISLIDQFRPIIGIIFAPALNELHMAAQGKGYFFKGKRHSEKAYALTAAKSRFHHCDEAEAFIKRAGSESQTIIGSALKYARIAQGEVDFFVRLQNCKSWDIAAGDCILHEAGGGMISIKDRRPIKYLYGLPLTSPIFAYSKKININEVKDEIFFNKT